MALREWTLSGIVLVLLPAQMAAQTVSTEILGLVTDPSGAIIAGAAVTAKRANTGDVRTTISNQTGNYVFPLLEIGEYEVTCAAPGFKTELRRGIVLQLNQQARLDFQMQLGQAAETVEIQGNAPLLRTEDATLGAVIESKRIVDLPLNGRNFGQLATLSPGVVFGASRMGQDGQGTLSDLTPPGQMVAISANGQRDANQHITLDGVVAVDPHHSAMLFAPSIEAIEEFKVQSAVYSAEFGMHSGAQVNVAIKSGTNSFHSTLFEFLRNDRFDARGFFLAPDQPKNPLRRNQFGAVVSGPVVRDKTFWLFNWESRRERRSTPSRGSVPTLAMRAGDFSELLQPRNRWYPTDTTPRTLRLPGSAAPFPNNIIPANLINPISQSLLTYQKTSPFPDGGFISPPNIDALAAAARSPINLAGNSRQAIDTDQYLGRGDHRFTDRDRLFARYVIVGATWDQTPLDMVSRQTSEYRSQNVGIGYTRILSPTAINELRYGLNRTRQDSVGIQTDNGFTQRDVGFNLKVGEAQRQLTPFEEGLPNLAITGYTGINIARSGHSIKQINEISDNFTINRGKHNFKVGGLYQFNEVDSGAANIERGSMTFTQDIVGLTDGFAAFLVGIPATANSAEGLPIRLARQNKAGFYGLDDWKATSRLTVNFGLRWDIFGPLMNPDGQFRNLSFADGEARVINGQFVPMLVPNPNVSKQLYDVNWRQIMPRLGIAYRFGKTMVLRLGAGEFYNAQQVSNFTVLALQPPFSGSATIQNDRNNPQATIQNPFLGSALTSPAALVMLGNTQADNGNRSLYLNNKIWQWTVDIEKSFGQSFVTGISYVGSEGSNIDLNLSNYNNPDPGLGAIQARRPIQNYADSRDPNTLLSVGTIRRIDTSTNSNYNALQLRAEKRYSHGLTFTASFNYQKAMFIGYGINENAGYAGANTTQDPRNRLADYARSPIDQRFRLVFSHVWELPWWRKQHGFKGVLGGWAINGIVQFNSGLPVSVLQSGDSQNTGGGAPRPNVVAGAKVDRVFDGRSIDQWFNVNAFVRSKCDGCPGEGTYAGPKGYGNAGKALFDAPAQKTWDFSMFKDFRIQEGHHLQFRWEAFNFLNTPQFSAPNATLGSAGFGRITATVLNNREMQFGLKYFF